MTKSELKALILKEAIYIKNLVEEKVKIQKTLKEMEGEVDETTGKGLGVQHRASHKGEVGKQLKVEDNAEEMDEMMGLGKSVSHQVGKNTTNPVYKSREKRGYVNEDEQKIRSFVKTLLKETYAKEELQKYAVKVKHDKGTTTIVTMASSEDAAKENVIKSEGCPERAIISVKKK